MMKVILLGHLGHDPRVRQLPSGEPVLNLSVSARRYRKREEETYWWDVTMFGERGLKLHDYLRKGSHVYVEGEYGERQYTDKEGRERTQREVVAREIRLLDRPPSRDDAPRTSRPMPDAQKGRAFGGTHRDDFAPGGRAQTHLPEPPPFDDSDIPF